MCWCKILRILQVLADITNQNLASNNIEILTRLMEIKLLIILVVVLSANLSSNTLVEKQKEELVAVNSLSQKLIDSTVQKKNKKVAQGQKENINNQDSILIEQAMKKSLFTYSFDNGTVSPEYQRRYTIKVTNTKVDFAISGWDKILFKESLVLSKSGFESFVTTLIKLHIHNRKENHSMSCTGGSSAYLEINIYKEKKVEGYAYYCGGKKWGNLDGDVGSAFGLFESLIPDLQEKMQEKN